MRSAAWSVAKKEIIARTIFASLMDALWPIALLDISKVVDNPFSVAMNRADKAGLVLADAIINKAQGERPVTLIGYSLGARLIYSCLMNLPGPTPSLWPSGIGCSSWNTCALRCCSLACDEKCGLGPACQRVLGERLHSRPSYIERAAYNTVWPVSRKPKMLKASRTSTSLAWSAVIYDTSTLLASS